MRCATTVLELASFKHETVEGTHDGDDVVLDLISLSPRGRKLRGLKQDPDDWEEPHRIGR